MYTNLIFFMIIMLLLTNKIASRSESKLVKIDQGLLRGFRYLDGNFFAFMSIPYATAPPGKDRFKAPLAAPVWMQTFNAVETGKVCPQSELIPKIGEDCLIANVFVPDTNLTDLPVMVYIHCGVYVYKSGDFIRYTKLVEMTNVIVVSFNYRLGVHGFLCLGTEDVPGNAGLKDQVALLRWIQKNIANFGGNPNDVTLVGCGSGGSAINLLSLSPMATGLFHKAVIESGLILDGMQIDPIENAKSYARALNFTDVENITALEEFYKTASYELLTSKTDDIINRDDSTLLFGPCVENDIGKGEVFISEPPNKLMKRKNYSKLPLLYGFSEMEGIKYMGLFEDRKDRMNENFENFLPGDLKFGSEKEKAEIAQIVKMFYFGEKNICDGTILYYINYFTDIFYTFPMLNRLSIRQNSGNATVYLFVYSFVDENSHSVLNTNLRCPGHCSLTNTAMDEDYNYQTKEYREMQRVVKEILLSFIKTGKPVSDQSTLNVWPSVDAKSWSPHMALHNATPELRKYLGIEDRMKFWGKIYQEYRRDPLPPHRNGALPQILSTYMILLVLYCCNVLKNFLEIIVR